MSTTTIDPTKQAVADTYATPTPSIAVELPDPSSYKVYRPPDVSASTSLKDIPATYFEPTATDIRTAQNSLHARTEALVNAPFRTMEMREAAEKARANKYPTATVRVKFSDRTQLEKVFPSTNKIKSVYAFVRCLLREDVKPVKFVLYQTPPPRELKVSDPKVRDLSLLQLQLVPTAVLHIKFFEDSLNHNDVQAPLIPSVLNAAIDFPLPSVMNESDDEPHSRSGRRPGLASARPSTSTQPGNPGLNTDQAQKKLGKFFKGLTSNKSSSK